mgnify:CR=1 FL=1
MATASELISNRGDAGLGAGANSGIAVLPTNPNLDIINKAAENIMLLDAQRNQQIFQQKVTDRNKQLELLEAGQISTGDILDKDRSFVNQLQEDTNKAFDTFIKKGGLNNPTAYQEYRKSIKSLGDAVTWAQHRKLGRDILVKEKSQQQLPDLQKAYDSHIEKADEGSFWSDYSPYQQTLSADFSYQDKLGANRMVGSSLKALGTTTKEWVTTRTKDGKPSTTVTQTTTAAAKGKAGTTPIVSDQINRTVGPDGRTYITSKQSYDYGNLKSDVDKSYLERTKDGVEMDMWRSSIEQNPQPLQSKQVLNYIQQRVSQYNQENGYQDSDPRKLNFKIGQVITDDKGQIVTQTDPNANVLEIKDANGNIKGYKINMSTAEFSAMTILAKHPGKYVEEASQWDKEGDEYGFKGRELDEKIRHDKALEAAQKSKNWLLWDQWQNKKGQLNKTEQVGKQKYDDILNAVQGNTVDVSKLPASRQFIGGIIYKDSKKQIGEVYPNFNVSDEKNNFLSKEGLQNKELTYGAYVKNYTNKNGKFQPAESYPEYMGRVAKGQGYSITPYYTTKYFSKNGEYVSDIKSLDPNLQKTFRQLKADYGITAEQYFKILGQEGKLLAEFQGSNGTANLSSILEGERFEQAQYGKKGFAGVYSDSDSEESGNENQ